MSHPNVLPGDIFCTYNPRSVLGRAVNSVQSLWLLMPERFTHAGIITDDRGNTFEALSTIKRSHLNDYKGQQILIGRHRDMTISLFDKGIRKIEKYEGMSYPYHRLGFFLFPPLAKFTHLVDWGVCSEISCKFLYEANLLEFWRGVFPGHLSTMLKRWKDFKLVYEGEWKGK